MVSWVLHICRRLTGPRVPDSPGSDYDYPEFCVFEGEMTAVAVAVDIQRGHIFWADQGKRTITRAALDGSNPEVIVNTGRYRAAGVRCC